MRGPDANKVVYWHRELPPIDAEPAGEHIVEATSKRVVGDLGHHGELWGLCYDDLMAHARERLSQEVVRLRGDCAHVLEESIDSRRDDATSETWLHGQFRFTVLKRPHGK